MVAPLVVALLVVAPLVVALLVVAPLVSQICPYQSLCFKVKNGIGGVFPNGSDELFCRILQLHNSPSCVYSYFCPSPFQKKIIGPVELRQWSSARSVNQLSIN